jgi:hypothetical protein
VSSQKRTCHVPYSTTHVCVAFTACADAAAVSAPSRARPTEHCAQVPRRARVEAHVLVASAARRVRVRKHPAIEQTNAALRLRLSRVCLVAHPVRSHRAQRSLHPP